MAARPRQKFRWGLEALLAATQLHAQRITCDQSDGGTPLLNWKLDTRAILNLKTYHLGSLQNSGR